MSTSASPARDGSRDENGNGPDIPGSTPRVKVTTRSRSPPRDHDRPLSTRLFQDPWTRTLRLEFLEFGNLELWRGVLLETIVTGMWVFGSILIICDNTVWGSDPLGRTLLVSASLHALMFIIYLGAQVSATPRAPPFNVQLNPAITCVLMLRGFIRPVYALMLMTGQCVGGILAAVAANDLIPDDRRDAYFLGGCYHKRTLVVNGTLTLTGLSDHQGFLADFIFSFTFLYVGLLVTQPKQRKALGIIMVTFVFSANTGFNLYISTALRAGYSGSMFNPARCLASAVAYGQPLWDRLWIPFLAPFVAAVAVGFLNCIVPVDHVEIYRGKKDAISRIRRSMPYRSRGDLESQSSHPDDNENNRIYDVPSAARRLPESPQTPDLRPPPGQSHVV